MTLKRRYAFQLWLRLLRFHAQHIWEQALNPGRNAESFGSIDCGVFANPRCPPGALAAASASAPIIVSGEKRSDDSPVAAEEETVLPVDLPTK